MINIKNIIFNIICVMYGQLDIRNSKYKFIHHVSLDETLIVC